MASEGQASPPTWAEITAAIHQNNEPSPLVDCPVLARLKETTLDFVFMDPNAKSHAKMRFQYSLCGKFFGKSPPLELIWGGGGILEWFMSLDSL